MQKLFGIVLILVLLISCERQSKDDILQQANIKISKKFEKDIPADSYYSIIEQREKQLKIESLESGYNSLQIRVWYNDELRYNKELLVIKFSKDKWVAEYYEMLLKRDVIKNTETISSFNVKPVVPESGWDLLIRKLSEFKIMTLPDMHSIPGLRDGWEDGVTYNIEIATKNQYRFYSYHVPGEFQNNFWQAKNMFSILDLLGSEFNIRK